MTSVVFSVLLLCLIVLALVTWHLAGKVGQLDSEIDHTHLLAHRLEVLLHKHSKGESITVLHEAPFRRETPEE